jgi:hypothetical protein
MKKRIVSQETRERAEAIVREELGDPPPNPHSRELNGTGLNRFFAYCAHERAVREGVEDLLKK